MISFLPLLGSVFFQLEDDVLGDAIIDCVRGEEGVNVEEKSLRLDQ